MHLPDEFLVETEDITRDEPSHHVAHLYNFDRGGLEDPGTRLDDPQKPVSPDGLDGNDDCGQMSPWYLFSALGFYPAARDPSIRSWTARS